MLKVGDKLRLEIREEPSDCNMADTGAALVGIRGQVGVEEVPQEAT